MEVLDPVCGMRCDASEAVATAEHGGTTYYFCGEGCKQTFEKEPERYIAGSGESEKTGAG